MNYLFCSSDGKYCAHFLDETLDVIKDDISRYHPLETGGILIGRYDSNLRMATISIATPAPVDSKHDRTSFMRGTTGVSEALSDAKKIDSLLHYLGEWHSHPSSTPHPSAVDSKQMQKFALKRLYGARTPLLLIVGGSPLEGLHAKVYLYRAKKAHTVLSAL
jgi:integrative and conjugative element protein (TIGR02256 family)